MCSSDLETIIIMGEGKEGPEMTIGRINMRAETGRVEIDMGMLKREVRRSRTSTHAPYRESKEVGRGSIGQIVEVRVGGAVPLSRTVRTNAVLLQSPVRRVALLRQVDSLQPLPLFQQLLHHFANHNL